MGYRRLALVSVALGAFAMAACSPVVRRHGFLPEQSPLSDITPAEDNKATVLARYGNPSTEAVFENDVWYYITDVQQRLGYLEASSAAREIVAVRFDDDGVVQDVETLRIADARDVNYVSRETPTRGRELSVLEQLLGNVGRLPSETLGDQENLPGGAGGPRR